MGIVGLPEVSVPVLSKITKSALAMFSIMSPPLATTPAADEADGAVACGTGAANNKAHGRETTHRIGVATMFQVPIGD